MRVNLVLDSVALFDRRLRNGFTSYFFSPGVDTSFLAGVYTASNISTNNSMSFLCIFMIISPSGLRKALVNSSAVIKFLVSTSHLCSSSDYYVSTFLGSNTAASIVFKSFCAKASCTLSTSNLMDAYLRNFPRAACFRSSIYSKLGWSSINFFTLSGTYFISFSNKQGYTTSVPNSSHDFGLMYFHMFPIIKAKRLGFLTPITFSEN